MSVRLSELAKELGTTKKELLEKLPALGFELKKSQVEIDDGLAGEITAALRKSGTVFEAAVKRPAPARPPRPRKENAVAHLADDKPRKPAIDRKPPAAIPAAQVRAQGHGTAVPAAEASPSSGPSAAAKAHDPRTFPGAPVVRPLSSSPAAAPAAVVAAASPAAPAARPAPATEPSRPAPPPSPPPFVRSVEPGRSVVAPLPRQAYESPRPRATSPAPSSGSTHPPAASAPPGAPRPSTASTTGGSGTGAIATAPGAGAGEAGRSVPEAPRTTPRPPRRDGPPRPGVGPQGSGRPHSGSRRPSSSTLSTDRTGSIAPPQPPAAPAVPLKPATLSEGVTVKEFAEKLNLKSRDVIKKLMERGTFATINQSLDREIAVPLARDFGFDVKIVTFEEESVLEESASETQADFAVRSPVVTVMGHVDHGKTTLLDAIRETNVAAREAGQITQHIGAYQVEKKGRAITFLDTPGHEAFTMMRARGAKVTDIVVLVVAADDGIMPQTVEAIHHARAAGVPILVAINKIDLPNANPDRVMQMLADQGLQAEEWGGETVTVKISAKKRIGLDTLLDLILLVADMQELRANPKRSAAGVVLEAKLDKGRGAVATVLVQTGTLHMGDPFIAGAVYGKVRAMYDDRGNRLEQGAPSTPVEVLGLQGVPRAGDVFQVVAEDWKARQIGSFRQAQLREQLLAKSSRLTLDALYKQIADGQVRELPIVLKGDVQGSVEALTEMLTKLSTDKVRVRIIHSGAGAITETDVLLASASNAIVVGFNVRPERKARDLAEQEQVDIRLHTIIYNVTNEIRDGMQGLLEPTLKETVLGRVEIRQLFRVPKIGTVAGCYVTEGRVTRDAQIRLLRDNVVIYEGKLASLRRFKEDAAEVRQGYECGLSVANYPDLKEGDVIEAFRIDKVQVKVN